MRGAEHAAAPGQQQTEGGSDNQGNGVTSSVAAGADAGMSRTERTDLATLARKRGRLAKTELDARAAEQRAAVETHLAAAGLTSDDAVRFLEAMPTPVDLLPEPDLDPNRLIAGGDVR